MASLFDILTGKFAGNCAPGRIPDEGYGYCGDDPQGMANPYRVGNAWEDRTLVSDPPPPPPLPSLSMAAFRLRLLALGHLDEVEGYMVTAAPREQQILWEYAAEVQMNDPVLGSIAVAIGLSHAEVAAVFAPVGSATPPR